MSCLIILFQMTFFAKIIAAAYLKAWFVTVNFIATTALMRSTVRVQPRLLLGETF